jgi:hypothetical protein
MSDTPTYANLLTRLFAGEAADRAAVMRHLVAHAADAHAVEAAIRDNLRGPTGVARLIAADAIVRVYRDKESVTAIVGRLFRGEEPLGTAEATDFLRAYAALVVRSSGGGEMWRELLPAAPPLTVPALMMGLADAAPASCDNLDSLVPMLRAWFRVAGTQPVAGAALWRVTWRINREWLTSLDPCSEAMKYPGLRALVLEVLIEHLGRRPDVASIVREMLASFAVAEPQASAEVVVRLVRLGSRGWGVLIPMLHPVRQWEVFPELNRLRQLILREAVNQPAVLLLVHHHAHGVILQAATEGKANDLIPAAAEVLKRLGHAAGMAIPDLLNLAIRVPSVGSIVGGAVAKVAGGFPNTGAAVVRALNRIRTAAYFGASHLDAFQSLAQTLAEIDLDTGPLLAGNTALDPRVPDLLLQQPGWKNAPPEVRRKHAAILADSLASSRPEVRIRAAELLRHYREELPAVWPALVAVLAGSDENAAIAVLPHFRHLESVAAAVSHELMALFQEQNPAYAARAVIALWRIGLMLEVGPELRRAVERDPQDGWGWAVVRGVIARVSLAHSLLKDLNELFAASPASVVEKLNALLDASESAEEKRITDCVPRPGDPTAPATVNWDALHQVIGNDGVSAALFCVALMCEYGSEGFVKHKIWMIKQHRNLTRCGLAESAAAVEHTMYAVQRRGASAADRRSAIRCFFAGWSVLPSEITEMLKHLVSWYRWAGLELADAWGLTAEQAKELTEDRVWDISPRVRERALRMLRG